MNPPVGSALIGNITLPPFAEKRDPVPDTLPDPLPLDPKKNPQALPSLPSGIGMSALPVGSSRMGFPPPVQGAPVTDATAVEPHFEPIGTVVIPKRVPIAGTAAPTAPGATQVPLPAAPPTPPLPVPPPGPAMPAPGR